MDNQRTKEKINKFIEKKKSKNVIKYLSNSDIEIVVYALDALSQIGDEDSRNTLAKMIDSENTLIRKGAVSALGKLGGEYAKSYLMHRLSKETEEDIKKAIRDALQTI